MSLRTVEEKLLPLITLTAVYFNLVVSRPSQTQSFSYFNFNMYKSKTSLMEMSQDLSHTAWEASGTSMSKDH